jgi:chaperone BCS1
MDVWINFKNATKWQAKEIFKNFFPCKPSEPPSPPTSQGEAAGQKGRPRRKVLAPVLTDEELADLAERFADAVPEDELSVS